MGNRIHVQIKREIEYGEEGFNWQIEELKNLLEDNGCDIYEKLNDDAIGEWEISDEQFTDAVEKIAEKSPEEIKNYFDWDFFKNESQDNVKNYVVSKLRKFVNTGDHRNGYYHFSWF